MANVEVSVRTRRHVRKSFTGIHNISNGFADLSQIERETTKLKIKPFAQRLL